MSAILLRAVRRLNVGRTLCAHMLGKDYSATHHMVVGAVVMAIGVFIAKTVGHHPVELVSYIGDGIGYAIHGLGLTPFVESLITEFGEAAVEVEAGEL